MCLILTAVFPEIEVHDKVQKFPGYGSLFLSVTVILPIHDDLFRTENIAHFRKEFRNSTVYCSKNVFCKLAGLGIRSSLF